MMQFSHQQSLALLSAAAGSESNIALCHSAA
jgi:hypothetical protein